ncbi:MAG TPA: C2 family cysteine protease [Acidisphaera sp.]|nr:C2 family cysteine protease [Acidisphaera sp.]
MAAALLAPMETARTGMDAAAGAHPGAPAPLTDVLYLQEPGDTSPISVDDLHQGNIGDCFLISSIGELALNDPSAISNMIHVNSNGTETVTLYEASNGRLPNLGTTQFKPVQVTVTNTFPSYSVNSGAGQDVVGNEKEIWPQVLEKAYATLNGGYGAIANGGYSVIALEELTGQPATSVSAASLSLSQLQAYVSAGDLIVMGTFNRSNLPDNLVGDHAHMFEGITMSGSTPMVRLGNPWGYDQPAAIPLSQLAQGIQEVDIARA